ncbi:hypothetical protein FNO01nite_24510 [Flavobacterium noncentrifugens]|uniref:HmuY protein n=1 Tax=Flavobacterium noncentrifugens TaxID=1128970 RepID=A0A1G9A132_9FLAO|nr:hypothetical protein [Flavobacterium noncentrifugens]GEP51779.1 hypothetical protein FNO01nite_24510 [Flavobacterium noncentrifugens]SDK20295.1 hypothetical protein SAMN04487935_2802 [Flavobacterium noncentrifugens]
MKKNAIYLMLALSAILISCSSDDSDNTEVSVTINSPVLVFSGTIEMAYLKSQSADPKCFLDLTTGKVYKVSEGAANTGNIDLTWGSRAMTPDQKYLVSPDDDFIFFTNGGSADLWQDFSLYAGWNARNIVRYWDFSKTNFDAVQTNADFDAFAEGINATLPYVAFEGTQSQLQRPILFETSRGEKHYIGVLKFTASNVNARTANYTIKLRSI